MSDAHSLIEPTLQDWQGLDLSLLWAYDGPVRSTGQDYRSRAEDAPRNHFGAWMIRQGQLELIAADTHETFAAGNWVIPAPGDRRQVFSADARIVSVCFQAAWPDGSPLFERPRNITFPATDNPNLERVAAALIRFIARSCPDPHGWLPATPASLPVQLGIQRHFLNWLAVFTRTMSEHGMPHARLGRTDPRVRRAAILLDRHPLGERLDRHALAQSLGLSASQLERLFTQRFRITTHHYFDNRRLEHARTELRASRMRIKEIAYELGFKQLAHFSAWFRRHEGCSPREYRRQANAAAT